MYVYDGDLTSGWCFTGGFLFMEVHFWCKIFYRKITAFRNIPHLGIFRIGGLRGIRANGRSRTGPWEALEQYGVGRSATIGQLAWTAPCPQGLILYDTFNMFGRSSGRQY